MRKTFAFAFSLFWVAALVMNVSVAMAGLRRKQDEQQ